MGRHQTPDPKSEFVTFRLTRGEKEEFMRLRGNETTADFIRRVVLRGSS